MKNVIGIDIGGSTTKIVGFTKDGKLIEPMSVKAADPITSAYGAFGKFTDVNKLSLDSIEKVMITGVGSAYISTPIYGLPCETRPWNSIVSEKAGSGCRDWTRQLLSAWVPEQQWYIQKKEKTLYTSAEPESAEELCTVCLICCSESKA